MRPGRELVGVLAMLGAIVASLALAAVLQQGERTGSRGRFGDLPRQTVTAVPGVAERVERIRGLRFDSLPRPRVIEAERFRALNEREASGERSRARLAAAEVETTLVGLLEPEADLSALAGDASELAAAAYDPRDGRLFLIADAVPGGRALAEFVLAHELTHALEDQRFGLEEPPTHSDDRALAGLALVEGTATAVMTEYARRHLDALALAEAALGLDTSTHGVPAFVVEQLGFAYLRGAAFVNALHAYADGWNVVDIALRERPPASTEQVLHPRRYLFDERPLPVALGPGPGPGWRRLSRGSIGEFATGQLLRIGIGDAASRLAAGGWGGDRYGLWARRGSSPGCDVEAECRADHAMLLRWRWDTRTDLRQFAAALPAYLREGLGGEPSAAGRWRLEGGWAVLSSTPVRISLAFAPSLASAQRLAG